MRRPKCRPTAFALLPPTIAVACLFAGAPAAATVVSCVASVAGLEAALANGVEWSIPEDGQEPAEAVDIRVVAGTYTGVDFPEQGSQRVCSDPPFNQHCATAYTSFGKLTLSGGWNAGCSSRSLNAGGTRIVASGLQYMRLLSIGDLAVDGLSFEGYETGLVGVEVVTANSTLRFSNNRIRSWVGAFEVVGAAEADVEFTGNLVYGVDPGQGLPSGERAAVRLEAGRDGTLNVSHNTIVDNAQSGLFLAASTHYSYGVPAGLEPAYAVVVNNLIWGHDAAGGDGTSDDLGSNFAPALLYNIYLTYVGPNPTIDVGNTHGDPGFVSSTVHDYRLAAGSPAVNTGTTWIPTGIPSLDLLGNPRPIGSGLDRGAYERQGTALPEVTVTSLANSGAGTLRQAILDANANSDLTRILFDLPAACKDNVISITSSLPDIVSSVVIDGTSQPGSHSNTLSIGNDSTICVGVRASGTVSHAFEMPTGGATSLRVEIRGLAMGGFADEAVYLASGSGHVLAGNRFGLGPGGDLAGTTFFSANRRNLILASGASHALVGGASPAHRNVFANATEEGLALLSAGGSGAPSGDHLVVGNYIGTGRTGSTGAGNGIGVLVASAGNGLRDNTIGDSVGEGVVLRSVAAHDNRIESNRIGYRATNQIGVPLDLPNGSHGILVDEAAHDNLVLANAIAYNGGAGIRVVSGQRNRLSANRLQSNDGLGIDLAEPGVDPIDNDGGIQAADLANRGVNFPTLASALVAGGQIRLSGTLTSTNGDYRIDVYSSASCDGSGGGPAHGEAALFHGSVDVAITNAPFLQNGQAAFTTEWLSTGYPDASDRYVAATVTDDNGNTSELSACVPLLSAALFSDGFESGGTGAWSASVP
ncbi:MAG: right-handed parallel beta-helix repeat-containing protein [Thermoanaerobaculia bacterium]